MRAIDADALMKDVRENSESYFADDFAEFWVNRQPTIQPEPHWIPVTERLPKKSGVYTVTDHKGDVVRFVFNTGSDSSRRYWYRCAKAWMPLPEPFKGVTE